jgi:hypothetical protein
MSKDSSAALGSKRCTEVGVLLTLLEYDNRTEWIGRLHDVILSRANSNVTFTLLLHVNDLDAQLNSAKLVSNIEIWINELLE